MKILIAAADPYPFFNPNFVSSTSAFALPIELQKAGHEVTIVTPWRATLNHLPPSLFTPTFTEVTVQTTLENDSITSKVFEATALDNFQIFLLKEETYFESIQCADSLAAASELQFGSGTLFAKLVNELARRLDPAPDIIQAQDWPGALALVFSKAEQLPFEKILSLTDPQFILNQFNHGIFSQERFSLLNLGPEWFSPASLEFYGQIHCLKAGILAADRIIIQRPIKNYLESNDPRLQAVLHENAYKLDIISSPLDTTDWNPATDKKIARKFHSESLNGKKLSANAFLNKLGLDKKSSPTLKAAENESLKKLVQSPVYLLRKPLGASSRDFEYFSLLTSSLDQLLSDDLRLLVIGNGKVKDADEIALKVAAKKYPNKMALLEENEDHWHQAFAASDFVLCLDRYFDLEEFVLRSMKFGCIPIFPSTPAYPGLEQILRNKEDFSEMHSLAFYNLSPSGLLDTIFYRARALMQPLNSAQLESMRRRVMSFAATFDGEKWAAKYTEAIFS